MFPTIEFDTCNGGVEAYESGEAMNGVCYAGLTNAFKYKKTGA